MSEPTTIERQNTDKVLDLLADIEKLSYKNIMDRADIFEISGPDGTACILDVEEKVVCISSEVCEVPAEDDKKLALLTLLMENNFKANHGKFTMNNGKIYFKENLEVENLDGNELESALAWTLAMVGSTIPQIAEII
jgi:hypothetical protein